ncbi:MAG: hypothetical protein AAFS10_20430, partial [Myxococcota bacterium]
MTHQRPPALLNPLGTWMLILPLMFAMLVVGHQSSHGQEPPPATPNAQEQAPDAQEQTTDAQERDP